MEACSTWASASQISIVRVVYRQKSFIAAILVDILEKTHRVIAGHYHLPGMGADICKWASWYLQSNEVEYFTFNNSSLVWPWGM